MREYPKGFLKYDIDKFHSPIVDFIRKFLDDRGFDKAVIGMSGGADSTLGAYLAVEALGSDNVTGLMMPYKTSNPKSLEHAEFAARELKIDAVTIDITPMIDAYFVRFPEADKTRRGNKMARERMSILYDHAKRKGALVMGTSNRTEIMLGYGTIFGDMASAINPIGAIYKTEVWRMGELVGVPDPIIEKAPSADLWKGQTDEGELGIDYFTADRILYYLVEKKMEVSKIEALGISRDKITKIMGRIESSEFKRHMPVIPEVPR
jgi:NAD+ synthase